jgi:hypothetical protein
MAFSRLHLATFQPFTRANIAASLTNSTLEYGDPASNSQEALAPFAGVLRGLSCRLSSAAAGSTLTASVFQNGSDTGTSYDVVLTPGAGGGGDQQGYTIVARGTATVVAAGDRLGVRITTTGSWTSTGSDIAALVWVELEVAP